MVATWSIASPCRVERGCAEEALLRREAQRAAREPKKSELIPFRELQGDFYLEGFCVFMQQKMGNLKINKERKIK